MNTRKVIIAWAAFAIFHSVIVSEPYDYQQRVPRFLPLPRKGRIVI